MLVLEQLLAGRDFARDDAVAAQMINFAYMVADDATKEAVLVDPAWDVAGLVAHVEREGYTLAGALVTHYHQDHCGGSIDDLIPGVTIEGLAELAALRPAARMHVHAKEADGIARVTGVPAQDLVRHEGGDTLALGSVKIEFVHTPGHTPGSECFLVTDATLAAGTPGSTTTPALVSGDTLFVGGCGRVDLPGADPDEMYRTLTQRLAKLPAGTVLYPGHDYGPTPTSTLAGERAKNPYLRIPTLDDWHRLMTR
jgi:glyoxylase-like metal-dependent hydrolase (beta-lactamase superfamily II)